jgi:hypothetical protein
MKSTSRRIFGSAMRGRSRAAAVGTTLAGLALALGLAAPHQVRAQAEPESAGPYDMLIIRNATIIDGTGAPARGPVDIVIKRNIIEQVLFEFPVKEINISMPSWIVTLPQDHWLKSSLYGSVLGSARSIARIADVSGAVGVMSQNENLKQTLLQSMNLGDGSVAVDMQLADGLFYRVLGEETGFENGHAVLTKEPYPVPLLNLYNDSHYEDARQLGTAYNNLSASAHAAKAFNVVIRGSGHLNFTDLPLFSPILAKMLGTGTADSRYCIETMNHAVLQFFDNVLKNTGNLVLQPEY